MKTNTHWLGIVILLIALAGVITACKHGTNPIYSADDLAAAFRATHADALALEVEKVAMENETIVNAALNDYAGLGNEVKSLLEKEKALLDDLKAKIDELNAAAAAAFKKTHAYALALTLNTVTVTTDNITVIDKALAAYVALGNGVKALLVPEKALLDSLKARIDDIQSYFGTYVRTKGYYPPYTVTITANGFRFEDNNGSYIDHTDINWIAAKNTATIGSPTLTNPSIVYPSGYTIMGTRKSYGYSATTLIPSPFFMALSANKNTLYVATSESNYNKAGFVDALADSVFTRIK